MSSSGRARSERVLIVNADDLGSTVAVNDGIFAAHRDGIVTSATLMVARSGAEDAAARLDRFPDLGVGLHVALTGGRPLRAPEDVPSLVDAEGRLPRHREGLVGADPDDLRAEVEAQLARFEALVGRGPTHLDGHHHCLRLAAVLRPMIDYARRQGIPVRRASEDVATRLAEAGIRTTNTFNEDFYAEGANLEALMARFEALQPGTHELMVHPGEVDDRLRETSTYTDARRVELEILTDPRVRGAIDDRGIRLATFADATLQVAA